MTDIEEQKQRERNPRWNRPIALLWAASLVSVALTCGILLNTSTTDGTSASAFTASAFDGTSAPASNHPTMAPTLRQSAEKNDNTTPPPSLQEFGLDDPIAFVSEHICVQYLPGVPIGINHVNCTLFDIRSSVADLVVHAYHQSVPDADFAWVLGRTCATDLPQGALTKRVVQSMLPAAGNLVVLHNVRGTDILQQLELSLEIALDIPTLAGDYPYLSGLRFDVDASGPSLERAFRVESRTYPSLWAPFDPDATYTIATNEQALSGGPSRLEVLAAHASSLQDEYILDTGKSELQVLLEYAFENKVLLPPPQSEVSTQTFIPEPLEEPEYNGGGP